MSKRLRLDDVEWKEFKIEELFRIESGKCSKVSSLEKGNIPYVGATNRNNGVISFVDAPEEMLTKGNSVAFICDGEGSIGLSIYRESSYVASTTVKIGFGTNLNRYIGKFITTVSDRVRPLYTFGYKRSTSRLKNEKLLLPINNDKEPNWQFMEDYIKQEQKIIAQKVIDYYEQKIIETDSDLGGGRLKDVRWQAFKIGKIFDKLDRGKTSPKQTEFGKTDYTYIGAKYKDNGVVDFVDEGRVFKGNAICFVMTGEGSVGKAFYKQEDFVPSNNIYVGYYEQINRFNAQFIISSINNQSDRYNYGYIRNDRRLKNETLILPITKDDVPDWQFMEDYIKEEEKQIAQKVINCYRKKKV